MNFRLKLFYGIPIIRKQEIRMKISSEGRKNHKKTAFLLHTRMYKKMKMEKIAAVIAGIILYGLAAVLSIALFQGFFDYGMLSSQESLLFKLGSSLLDVYGYSSIFIPLFLFVAGCFSFSSKWTARKAAFLSVSLLPFFTLTFSERISRKILAEDTSLIAVSKVFALVVIAVLLVLIEYLLALTIAGKISEGRKKSRTDSKIKAIKKSFQKKDNDEKENIYIEDNFDEKSGEYSDYESDDDLPVTDDSADEEEKDENSFDYEEITAKKEKFGKGGKEKRGIFSRIFSGKDEKKHDNDELGIDEELSRKIDESVDTAIKESTWSVPDLISENADVEEKKGEKSEENKNAEIDFESDPWNVNEDDYSDEDDVIAQFEESNREHFEEEEKTEAESDTEDEDFESEIPFEEYTPEENDENIYDNIEEKEDSEEDDENKSDDFIIEEKNEEETEEDFVDEEQTEKINDDSDIEEKNLLREESSSENTEKTEILSKPAAEEKNVNSSGNEKKKEGTSLISALDSIFAEMEEDAASVVEGKESSEEEKIREDKNDEEAEDKSERKNEDKEILKSKEIVSISENVENKNSAGSGKSEEIETSPQPERKTVEAPKKKHTGPYKISTEILTEYEENEYWIIDDETKLAAQNLIATLKEFGIVAEVKGIKKGPVVTMFEILPAPGVNVRKIVGLQDNIALRLAASSVRIIAPIPGKSAVGIEVPNEKRAIVSFRECIEQSCPEWKKMAVPVVLGKDIQGGTQIMDLVKTPHLLIAGSTGAGKSVCVNSMILSILFKRSPNQVKLILIDPKVVELKLYNDIPHLLTPVITDPKRALQALNYCLCEMERRYALLDGMGVRDIASYNKKIVEKRICAEQLPFIIVVIDEFADLMATTGKQLESVVARLAAMSRAVGIHLVLATQRPSVNVITGLIKANIPSRIAFMVAGRTDSNIIIDTVGAEKLLGKGDMLYASATDPFPIRIQGAFVSDSEVENVVEAVKEWGEPEYIDDEIFIDDDEDSSDDQMSLFGDGGDDPLYEKALEIVMQAGKASASYIQRRLKIGYNRAARLVEEMEERGIVGPANGSKPREIIQAP